MAARCRGVCLAREEQLTAAETAMASSGCSCFALGPMSPRLHARSSFWASSRHSRLQKSQMQKPSRSCTSACLQSSVLKYCNVCYTCPRLRLPWVLQEVLRASKTWAKAGAYEAPIVISMIQLLRMHRPQHALVAMQKQVDNEALGRDCWESQHPGCPAD